jgi:hypothetical protein
VAGRWRKSPRFWACPEKTLRNQYGKSKFVKLMQQAVREVVLGLPKENRFGVEAHLYAVGLSPQQVMRLLCLDPDGREVAFWLPEAA